MAGTPLPAVSLFTFRCRVRAYDHACNTDGALDTIVELKAHDAAGALKLARQQAPGRASIVDIEQLAG